MPSIFRDRKEAGQKLAGILGHYAGENTVVLALPRGGVPVAFEVARALGAPLDVLLVRKVGAPGRPELGIGAVGEGGARFLDQDMIFRLALSPENLRQALEAAERQVEEGLRLFRGQKPGVDLRGKTAILVDDGIATGGTMRAAIEAARMRGAARTVVAVPVAGPESLQKLAPLVDDIICVEVSSLLWAVGLAYEVFEQVPTDAVQRMLQPSLEHGAVDQGTVEHEDVDQSRPLRIPVDGVTLEGDLTSPRGAFALVVFAHGSGSSRKSHRNRLVARYCQEAGMATLLFDLLSQKEARVDALTAEHRFDIDLLARRTIGVVDWTKSEKSLKRLPLACFGASTGAAGALAAAAERQRDVMAVVSRGGRPDLASRWLHRVRAPCLLIVGEQDHPVLAIHAQVVDKIAGHTRLVVVHGAGHLFEEPGAIEEVARRSAEFLRRTLGPTEVRVT